MARFRGTINGSRGEASRLGTPGSGLTVNCNGWDIGIKCVAVPRMEGSDRDEIAVWLTGGSHGNFECRLLGRAIEGGAGVKWYPGKVDNNDD